MAGRLVQVQTSTGAVVLLTRERCQAVQLDGSRCCSYEFRGGDGQVLCWTHRQAFGFRRLQLVASVGAAR